MPHIYCDRKASHLEPGLQIVTYTKQRWFSAYRRLYILNIFYSIFIFFFLYYSKRFAFLLQGPTAWFCIGRLSIFILKITWKIYCLRKIRNVYCYKKGTYGYNGCYLFQCANLIFFRIEFIFEFPYRNCLWLAISLLLIYLIP